MEVISSKRYPVMDGEPHLGTVVETEVRVDREEYIEALVEAILDGCNETTDTFRVVDDEHEQTYTLGDDLSETDLDRILSLMDEHLLDESFTREMAWNLVMGEVNELIPNDWEDVFEAGGY